ncbi:phosphatidylinositol N-acetylglucosaminyltransferase subunit Q [Cylas formicarius]|uniref:phosphatidylinositol N-acetylglucosaminyltransferase subunit Q n=1 Tax=Cylas formicarius TaxID=197179 RepID=UPI0029586A4A|nr:phosphatidylinositol N-acetylglucosaminyltransferase subunit Q [Cylas formicarius]
MGSPIGLKLNHAFNNSLGMFFFYHINLWRIFLQATRPLLNEYFLFLVLPAVLGVSFQFAMLIDIVSMMTFHVYCIYVYAARLFSLQVKGLVSLWRLFIGRKHNPLRNRVDSCEYSPNQLFIGTLGFTILLFLLPTTTMYYIVFATFRMTTLLFNNLLASLKNFFNALPLYVIFLWICNSPSVAGSLYIKWNDCDGKNIQIEAKLSSLSLTKSLQKFKPGPKKSAPRTPLGNIVRHFFTGTLV